MAEMQNIDATVRGDSGTGAARAVRREGRVPAVIYGGPDAAVSISLDGRELNRVLRTPGLMTMDMTVTVEGKAERVRLQDVQRHPVSEVPLHLDFIRR